MRGGSLHRRPTGLKPRGCVVGPAEERELRLRGGGRLSRASEAGEVEPVARVWEAPGGRLLLAVPRRLYLVVDVLPPHRRLGCPR